MDLFHCFFKSGLSGASFPNIFCENVQFLQKKSISSQNVKMAHLQAGLCRKLLNVTSGYQKGKNYFQACRSDSLV